MESHFIHVLYFIFNNASGAFSHCKMFLYTTFDCFVFPLWICHHYLFILFTRDLIVSNILLLGSQNVEKNTPVTIF